MKIKWGALVVDGRNKIGGHVASKNRAGAYLRTKVTPVNPQSAAQTAVRNSFGTFSQAWSSLTASLIAAWNAAVSDWQTTDIFGDLKKPTGKNLFLRLNQQATQAGWSSFNTVPAKAEMPDAVLTSAVIAVGAETISLNGLYGSADARFILQATPQLSAGTTFVKNKLRKIHDAECGSEIAGDMFSDYANRFGVPSANDNIYLGVKYVLENGQASPLQIIKASVTA